MPPVERIDIVRHPAEPELVHLVIRDRGGATGTGETHGHASAVAALAAELAPELIGRDASPAAAQAVTDRGPYGTRRPAGPVSVESRAASAFAIALWDLAARRAGAPLYDLAGTRKHRPIVPYTTCVDADHEASLTAAAALARSVAADGYSLMKVWPFSPGGDHERALAQVSDAIGQGVGVAVDLVGLLGDDEVARVVPALDGLGVAFIEDPVADDRISRLRDLFPVLSTPICAGERFAGAPAFDMVLTAGVDIVHADIAWCGGPDELIAIAARVAAAGRRLALHDVSGPITWATSLHLARIVAVPTFVECARTAVRDRYPLIADGLPDPASGNPPAGPGHGLTLREAYLRDAAVVTVT
jgi:L-alanine-DL-glutamate epimerase-like enolase superfamily enzyme